jgi:4-amino-4-deoxy-L-arabinose transferase-like glycosyltransferase
MPRSAQAATERVGLARFAPPASLAALLVIVVTIGVGWALTVAPFQSPDELAHFAYAQSLATRFQLPGVKTKSPESSAQIYADDSVGASRGAFFPQTSPPTWDRSAYDAYLARVHGSDPPSPGNGGGPTSASGNPPLYYLYAAVGYLFDHSGTTFGQLYSIRLWGVLLLALTALGGWLLAGEVLGRRRLAQLACAAVIGLEPMLTFMSTAVNPDALTITAWTLGLWLGARVINHRAQTRDVAAMFALAAVAILTKADSYALAVADVFAVFVGWRRRPVGQRRDALPGIGVAALALVAPVIAWLGLAASLGRSAVNQVGSQNAPAFNPRQFLSYVWQFYLPRLGFLTPFRATRQLPAYALWYKMGLGEFGWETVALPTWIYTAGLWIGGAISVVTIALLTRLRGVRLALLAYLVLAWIALLVVLHVTDYRVIINGQGAFVTGRYILPAIGLLGLAVGLIVSRVPLRARPAVCGLVLVSMLSLQVVALSSVLQAFYL